MPSRVLASLSKEQKRDLLLCAAIAGLFACLLFWLAGRQRFDYDEIAEFHATWQVAQGHKPYVDFDYDHSPYFWLLCAPVLRALPQDFDSLVLLRRLNLATSFLAIGLFLWLLVRRRRARAWKTMAVGAFALLALQVPIAATFAQFRSDHLVLALTLGGLLLLDRDDGRPASARRWGGAGFLFSAGALITPKLVLIGLAATVVYGLELRRAGARATRLSLAAFAAGAASAFVVLNAGALLAGVSPAPYFRRVLQHHLLAVASFGYRFGLARGLLLRAALTPLWVLVFVFGAAASALALREEGWSRHKVLAVLLAFALLQPLWVKYLWSQYLYTVLLVWSLPLALFFERLERERDRWIQAGLCLLFLGGVWQAMPGIADDERDRRGLAEQVAFGDALLARAPADRPVSIQPPAHPVFRENSTYFFNYSVIPAGPDTEQLMQRAPDVGRLFTYAGYLEQLERRPPSLILVDPIFAGHEYLRAVDAYLNRHPRDYAKRLVRGVPVFVRRMAL